MVNPAWHRVIESNLLTGCWPVDHVWTCRSYVDLLTRCWPRVDLWITCWLIYCMLTYWPGVDVLIGRWFIYWTLTIDLVWTSGPLINLLTLWWPVETNIECCVIDESNYVDFNFMLFYTYQCDLWDVTIGMDVSEDQIVCQRHSSCSYVYGLDMDRVWIQSDESKVMIRQSWEQMASDRRWSIEQYLGIEWRITDPYSLDRIRSSHDQISVRLHNIWMEIGRSRGRILIDAW